MAQSKRQVNQELEPLQRNITASPWSLLEQRALKLLPKCCEDHPRWIGLKARLYIHQWWIVEALKLFSWLFHFNSTGTKRQMLHSCVVGTFHVLILSSAIVLQTGMIQVSKTCLDLKTVFHTAVSRISSTTNFITCTQSWMCVCVKKITLMEHKEHMYSFIK